MTKIPVTVIIATKNESARIEKCIDALQSFEQILVIDSNSADNTAALARKRGAHVVQFEWNGRYPKKRQWCLDNLGSIILHDWVFFVDADEIMTVGLIDELRAMDWQSADKRAGYFVRGQYIMNGKPLRFGLKNNKLALFNRRAIHFPIVDDLAIPGMGEIEGHYQPVLKDDNLDYQIGQIKMPLLHDACDDREAWHARHKRYAMWERGMDAKNAWPSENSPRRQYAKSIFRSLPPSIRAFVAFAHSYFYKLGMLDGINGYEFAQLRAKYYAQQDD